MHLLSCSPPGTRCQHISEMKESTSVSVCVYERVLDDKGMHVCGYSVHQAALCECV